MNLCSVSTCLSRSSFNWKPQNDSGFTAFSCLFYEDHQSMSRIVQNPSSLCSLKARSGSFLWINLACWGRRQTIEAVRFQMSSVDKFLPDNQLSYSIHPETEDRNTKDCGIVISACVHKIFIYFIFKSSIGSWNLFILKISLKSDLLTQQAIGLIFLCQRTSCNRWWECQI